MPVKNPSTKTGHPLRGVTLGEKQTVLLARRFGSLLRGGELVCLRGALGSGKTTFVRALIRGFGIKSSVRSPTFVLLNRYFVRFGQVRCLIHVDGYRLKSWRDLEGLGLLDYLGRPDTIVLIEWPPRGRPPTNGPVVKISLKPRGLRNRTYSITTAVPRSSR